jgi:hypothetical protein
MTDIQRLPQPADLARVESGVVQFGDDWPGVFIRGDNALTFAHMLTEGLTYIPSREYLLLAQLACLADTLQSCSVGDTGWPPSASNVAPSKVRDVWIERFETRKRELIAGGMSPEEADEKAARNVITELRES